MLVIGFGILIALAARAAAADPLDAAALDDADAELRDDDIDIDERTLAAADAARAGELELGSAHELDAATELALAHGGAGLGEPRQPRSSRWGRLDLAVSWRRRIDDAASMDKQRDEVWLLAVWSR